MDKFVIFNTSVSSDIKLEELTEKAREEIMTEITMVRIIWVLFALIAAAYIADVLVNRFVVNTHHAIIVSNVLAIVSLLLHLGIFALLFVLKATPEEMLFLIMMSVALALTASRIKKEVSENGI